MGKTIEAVAKAAYDRLQEELQKERSNNGMELAKLEARYQEVLKQQDNLLQQALEDMKTHLIGCGACGHNEPTNVHCSGNADCMDCKKEFCVCKGCCDNSKFVWRGIY